MTKKFDIEELLKTSLTDENQQVPPDLFLKIDKRIIKKKKKRRLLRFLFWSGMIIMLVYSILLIRESFNTNSIGFETEKKQYSKNKNDSGNIKFTDDHNRSFTGANDNKKNEHKESTESANYDQEFKVAPDYSLYNDESLIESENKPELLNDSGLSSGESNDDDMEFANIDNSGLNTPSIKIIKRSGIGRSDNKALNYSFTTDDDKSKKVIHMESIFTDKVAGSMDSIILPYREVIAADNSNKSLTSEQKVNREKRKNSIVVYSGPVFYDIAVFKPYFVSGVLSNQSFQSGGFEIGVNYSRNFSNRLKFSLSGIYNQKRSGFTYDLLIGEEDYFNLYQNNILIPIDKLDSPNSCNCFLAEDVELNYQIQMMLFSAGLGFELFESEKVSLETNIDIATNLQSKFINNSNKVVKFVNSKTETFNAVRLKLGINFGYRINNRFLIYASPAYSVYYTNSSKSMFVQPLREIILPVGLSIEF